MGASVTVEHSGTVLFEQATAPLHGVGAHQGLTAYLSIDETDLSPGGLAIPMRGVVVGVSAAAISAAISVPLLAAQRRSMLVIHTGRWGGLRGLNP